MQNANQDLLELCQLNIMEEQLEGCGMDNGEHAEAIKFAKRRAALRIINDPSPISQEMCDRRAAENQTIIDRHWQEDE